MSVWLSFSTGESSVDIANNTSVFTVNVYANWNAYHWSGYQQPGTIYIDGTGYSFTHSFNTGQSTSGSCWIGAAAKTITHNSDGSKSIGYSASYTTGTSQGTVSNSGSATLTTIPRVSDISANDTEITADGSDTVTVTATKKSSSFTDVLTFTLGTKSKTITSGTAFTIPLNWCTEMPSATQLVGTATVETFSGSTSIGTKSVNITVKVPASLVPTISNVSVSEAVPAVTTNFGNRFVQHLSKLLLTATATGQQGASIISYNFNIDGVLYGTNGVTTNTINGYGNITLTTTVTDSRGRQNTNTQTLAVVPYNPPSIHSIISISGTTLTLSMTGDVSSVQNQNTKSILIKYKKSSDSTYTEITHIPSAWSFTNETRTFTIDPTVTYEFITILSDKIESVQHSVLSGIPALSFYAGGRGATFGAEASTVGLVLSNGWDMKIEDASLQAELVAVFGNSIVTN